MNLDIMGIWEIGERIGKDRHATATLHQRGKLPKHDGVIGGGRTKVWRTSTIERWIGVRDYDELKQEKRK